MNIYAYVIAGMSGSFLLSIGIFLFYLKYKKNLLQQQYILKVTEVQHQKDLLHTVITSQEQERKRIGMDLHDEVGSTLSSLRLMIENFADATTPVSLDQFNVQCKSSIDSIVTNVRNISHDLSPLLNGNHGLHDAVHDFCDGIRASGKISAEVSFEDDTDNIPLSETTKLALYRVIIELINNTIKHAKASELTIKVSNKQNVYAIQYSDNGIGISPSMLPDSKGMGLQNIESRLSLIGASQTIGENDAAGFQILITLPLNQ